MLEPELFKDRFGLISRIQYFSSILVFAGIMVRLINQQQLRRTKNHHMVKMRNFHIHRRWTPL